jgi:microcystin-dependent protein
MLVAKVKKTSLVTPFSSSDTQLTVKELVTHKDVALAIADFDNLLVATIRQGDTIEMVLCDGITQNADGTATLDVATDGRDLAGEYPYTGGATGEDFNSAAEVVVSDDPYTIYQITKAYMDALALSGASDASVSAKGILEIATDAEIDADTELGGTGAHLAVTPDKLATTKYATQLPTTGEKAFLTQILSSLIGVILPYGGAAAPSGFLLCDWTAYDIADYPSLAAILLGKYGYNAGTAFTATAATDVLNATSHGLEDGDKIFLSSSTTLPAGLSPNTLYFVRDKDTNTFKLSATSGGAAIDITDTGTGTHKFHTQFKVPDLRSSFPVGQGQKVKTFDFLDAAVSVANNTIDLASNAFLYTGAAVVLSNSGGALPGGLSATTYYVIRISATQIKLATTVANANAGTAVDITSAAGGGTHTLTLTLTSRAVGDEGGEETHALTDAEMPSHFHTVTGSGGSTAGLYTNSSNVAPTSQNTDEKGSDAVHNNMPPYTGVNFIIKT